MEKTECYTYFAIKGIFDPNEITSLLKLQPQKCWSIGQERKKGIGKYNFALWEYGRQGDYNIEAMLRYYCRTKRQDNYIATN